VDADHHLRFCDEPFNSRSWVINKSNDVSEVSCWPIIARSVGRSVAEMGWAGMGWAVVAKYDKIIKLS